MKSNLNLIAKYVNNDLKVVDFILKHFDLDSKSNIIISTSTIFNIDNLPEHKTENIINLKVVNDFRFINKNFEATNKKLPISGKYLGCVETYPDRKKIILSKYPFFFNWLAYYSDYTFKRIFPKLKLTKWLYFYLTKGKGRVLSKAETYGRLYSCGYEILDEITSNNLLYFLATKVNEPTYDTEPTYGPIIRLKRMGKGGVYFKIFKLRTMYPYSEYLQEYIYNLNNLKDGGKIKNDFRISPEGKFLRKFWIDEIPMILNILKGDIKLVGVRPLSPHFFSLYSKDLQQFRTNFKPGFIPPFYVDLPKTIDEIMVSEMRYLKEYQKNPIKTDIKYLILSLKNVFFNGVRSD